MADPQIEYVIDPETGEILKDADGYDVVTDGLGNYRTFEDGQYYDANFEYDDEPEQPARAHEAYAELSDEQIGQAAGKAIEEILDDHPSASEYLIKKYGDEKPEGPPPTFAESIDKGLDEAKAEAAQAKADEEIPPETV
jgi:hypothetical protein